jgi:DNA repair exonuclease SbcCD nuclease subunit
MPAPHHSVTVRTQDPSILRAVLVGDIGHRGAHHEQVARSVRTICAQRGCDLILVPGDNLYPRGVQAGDEERLEAVLAPYDAVEVPIFMVLGNHDWGHGFDAKAAQRQLEVASKHENWILPSFDHEVRAGPGMVLGVDTTRAFWNGPQGRDRWVGERLVASDAAWRVVVGHHPLRSDGPHGDAGEYEGWSGVPFLSGQGVRNLLEEQVCAHADLYLSGHDHSRQWLSDCGVQHVISGAGSSITDLPRNRPNRMWGSATLGSVWLEMGQRLTIAFFDAQGQLEQEFHVPRRSR